TGHAGHHARQVELDHLAERRDLRVVGAAHALFLRVALDQVDVGGGATGTAGSALWKRTPTTTGASRNSGWPSMQASASMPPTPQPSTPMPLTIGVCESVPTSVSGRAMRRPPTLR